jgi:hypothetical protein
MSSPVAERTDTIASLTLRRAAPAATHARHLTPTHGLSSTGIALVAIGAVVVLACIVWGLSRVLTFEPRWTLSLRHAMAEASFRASATWSEFSDWARLGR